MFQHHVMFRKSEIIIGQGVTNVVNRMMTPEQAISYINQRLLNETHT